MVDDLDDRLSRRFEGGQEDDQSKNDMSSIQSETSETSGASQKSQKAENIKKEWNVRSVYLDDDLDDELMTAFKRLDLELSEADTDIDLKKTRHFYPLVVELGLERLNDLGVTEVTERLE